MQNTTRKALMLASMKVVVAIALALGMSPLAFYSDLAFAEEPIIENTSEGATVEDEAREVSNLEDESLLPINKPDANDDKPEVDATAPSEQGVEEGSSSNTFETEASEQIANSFRFENGIPIQNGATDGFQTRDMSARAGANSYITFSQGSCSGVDAARGIDVSSWQGSINWRSVKSAEVNFAILKCASGISTDPFFSANVDGCRASGIGFGVYYYSYATHPSQGTADAQRVISQLRSKGISSGELTYPIYYDLEDDVVASMSASDKASLTRNFVNTLRGSGYSNVGVYANMDWWCNKLTDPYFRSSDLQRWVAQYNTVGLGYNFPNNPFGNFRDRGDVWQFSSSGRVAGISGNVDLNYSYKDLIGLAPEGSMFRMYNPNSGEHFYTSSAREGNNLIKAGWRYEGIAWLAPKSSKTPVYRMYNPNAGDHHYTPSANERDSLIRAGWNYEGIGWYSDDAKATPLHRLYNPNAYTGSHHYTTSKAESDNLVRVGWRYEGIGWHGK